MAAGSRSFQWNRSLALNSKFAEHVRTMPEKRLPMLETAGFDLMAQVEAMSREARQYQLAVQKIRELVESGDRDKASLLLTEGPVMSHMRALRRESLTLAETIDHIETFVSEERASRA
jgi:hypothetical protein